MKRTITKILAVIMCIVLTGCSKNGGLVSTSQNVEVPKGEIKNVIIMIGDGMGYPNIDAARYLTFDLPIDDDDKFEMEKLPYSGSVVTASATTLNLDEDKPTDSAAAATAIATGVKTYNGSVGLDEEQNYLINMMEAARDAGMKTGVVTTKVTTDATPAGFSAHSIRRHEPANILYDQLTLGLDVLVGSYPMDYYRYDEDTEFAKEQGYVVTKTAKDYLAAYNEDGGVIGWIEESEIRSVGNNVFADVTTKTLELLENEDGFVVMIEGGAIDSYAHTGEMDNMTGQICEFDNAVKAAYDWAKDRDDTIIIVTADHQTGSLILPDEVTSKDDINDSCFPNGVDGGHDNVVVPIFAYGKGAEDLINKNNGEAIDNTDITKFVCEKLNLYEMEKNWEQADETDKELKDTGDVVLTADDIVMMDGSMQHFKYNLDVATQVDMSYEVVDGDDNIIAINGGRVEALNPGEVVVKATAVSCDKIEKEFVATAEFTVTVKEVPDTENNLIKNGGFEYNWACWEQEYVSTTGEEYNYSSSSQGNTHQGDGAIKLWYNTNNESKESYPIDLTIYQDVEIEAGTYNYSLWYYGRTTGITMSIYDGDEVVCSQTFGGYGYTPLPGYGGFTTFDYDLEIENSKTYTVKVRIEGEAGCWGYVDDITLWETE